MRKKKIEVDLKKCGEPRPGRSAVQMLLCGVGSETLFFFGYTTWLVVH
jgi:hypothetical protein